MGGLQRKRRFKKERHSRKEGDREKERKRELERKGENKRDRENKRHKKIRREDFLSGSFYNITNLLIIKKQPNYLNTQVIERLFLFCEDTEQG